MTTYDPYRPPAASVDEPVPAPAGGSGIPDRVVALLAETRPWVKLLAILFFVGMGLGTVGVVVAMAVVSTGTTRRNMLGGLAPLFSVLLLYIPSVVFMWRYAASIRRLEDGGGVPALEEALSSQKSFWKYVG